MKRQIKASNEITPHYAATKIIYNYLFDCRENWKTSKYNKYADSVSYEEVDSEIKNILDKIGSEVLWKY